MDMMQIRRREQIMQQLWAIEDANPDAATLRTAAAKACEHLQALIGALDDNADPAEAGRTMRYLADCYYTGAMKKDAAALASAREAYLEARPFVERGGDLLDLAKLDFNLANTSRLIEGGRNMALMQEAKRRYYSALLIFRTQMPQGVSSVEDSLQSLEVGIRALHILKQAEQGMARTADLRRRLEQAGANPPASLLAEIQRELDGTEKADAASQIEEVQHFLEDAGPLLGNSPQHKREWETQRRQFAALARQWILGDQAGSQDWEQQAYDMVFDKLREAGESGEVTPARKEALSAVLKSFRQIQQQKPATPEEMVAQLGLMRTLINRYKGMTDRAATFGG